MNRPSKNDTVVRLCPAGKVSLHQGNSRKDNGWQLVHNSSSRKRKLILPRSLLILSLPKAKDGHPQGQRSEGRGKGWPLTPEGLKLINTLSELSTGWVGYMCRKLAGPSSQSADREKTKTPVNVFRKPNRTENCVTDIMPPKMCDHKICMNHLR